jgi:nucleoside-diphosphate-sugar epimerase
MNPNRVLVLGSRGCLTPELLRLLEQDGVPTRTIGSKENDLTAAGSADRLALEIKRDDAMVMPAALTPDKGRDVTTLMKNLRMAENVCGALARVAPAHFIYVSSDPVYDGRDALSNEGSSCEPTDLYALMHIAREKMLGAACRAAGVPFLAVRPCAIYGSRDTHNSYGPNRFVRTAQRDRKITLFGGGEEQRHHVHVTDVAKILRLSLLHRSAGIINAITQKAASFREIAEVVMAAIGGGVQLECLPRSTPITHRHFDLTGLAKAFPGFSPISLEAGIEEAVAGMRDLA